jgi:hypothetical protein
MRSQQLAAGLVAALAVAGAAGAQVSAPSPEPTLQRGETVPPFDAEGLDGAVKHIAYPRGSTTVLLFFLSGCPTCHKMIPEWNRAYDRRPKGVQVFGVLLDHEPPGFFMATPISFPILRSPGAELTHSYKVQKVPMTVRIGGGGEVQVVAVGPVDPIRLGEIFHP